MIRPGYSVSIIVRSRRRNPWVCGRFSQFVPSSSKR
jgi:hypothetical protein